MITSSRLHTDQLVLTELEKELALELSGKYLQKRQRAMGVHQMYAFSVWKK